MSDQAHKLRLLAREASPAADVAAGPLPMVVVTGSRAGVGATTVALNLAAVLADRSDRVLLVDGAEQRNSLPESAGLRCDVRYGLADLLAGKCEADDAIVQGPAGVQMLLNRWSAHKGADYSRNAQQRILSELQSLSERFDLIVVDAGRGLTPWSRRFWSHAKLNLLVTTPDDGAVLDAYAVLKLAMGGVAEPTPIALLVNQADSRSAADAEHRIENACHKFLSRSIQAFPALPRSFDCGLTGVSSAPRVWELPNTPFGHAALWLGRAVNDVLAENFEGAVGRGSPDPAADVDRRSHGDSETFGPLEVRGRETRAQHEMLGAA